MGEQEVMAIYGAGVSFCRIWEVIGNGSSSLKDASFTTRFRQDLSMYRGWEGCFLSQFLYFTNSYTFYVNAAGG